MKKSGFVAASVAVASASAARATSSSTVSLNNKSQYPPPQEAGLSGDSNDSSSLTDKFAPRFDGLRFIETLITAHR
ncbi:hypothetical protein Nepgr_013928 [Nepenthes gracilis]|uniref:Uncharacterized protein n=1 Tax=Nepenthes gracilis TaxID=150966 RepID=A0AAD3XP30_NEPGR|nr:hypothetical protein Nepgr_013928 [Nepenthes gracilis]